MHWRQWIVLSGILVVLVSAVGCGHRLPVFVFERISNPDNGSTPAAPAADGLAPGGDRENAYAWCMDVLPDEDGGSLYVGMGRDLMYVFAVAAGWSDARIQSIFRGEVPEATDGRARMFRWQLDGTGDFEEVYRSPALPAPLDAYPRDLGFRGCLTHVTPSGPALFAATVEPLGVAATRILKFPAGFVPGQEPQEVLRVAPIADQGRNSLRPLAIHDGQLFVGTQANDLFAAADPPPQPPGEGDAHEGWSLVATDADFGGVAASEGQGLWQMLSFNGWLYVVLGNVDPDAAKGPSGFRMYKGRHAPEDPRASPTTGWIWLPIVAEGSTLPPGLGIPEFKAASLTRYRNWMYVGTLTDVLGPLVAGGVSEVIAKLRPAHMYRFDTADRWDMVAGDPYALFPTRLGDRRAGFYLPGESQVSLPAPYRTENYALTPYVWRMEVWEDRLFATTFDARTMTRYVDDANLQALGVSDESDRQTLLQAVSMLSLVNSNPPGFDLWVTDDGLAWWPITVSGFGDPLNMGGRTLKATDHGLFVGTANPFYGAQVWRVRIDD